MIDLDRQPHHSLPTHEALDGSFDLVARVRKVLVLLLR